MTFLVITFCLSAAPADCRIERVPLYGAGPLQCVMGWPQNLDAARERAMPGEVVADLRCEAGA